jgi:hypothetical protein
MMRGVWRVSVPGHKVGRFTWRSNVDVDPSGADGMGEAGRGGEGITRP